MMDASQPEPALDDFDELPTDPPQALQPSVVDPVDARATPTSDDELAPPHHLAPSAVALWRTQRFLRLGLMGLPLYGAMAAGLSTVAPMWVGIVLAGMLFAFSLLMAVAWPPLQYDAYRYAVREHDLLVQSGVVYRRWSSVPLSRIQHVDTRQGPMERLFGVQRLLVYTAAGVSADGVIPALTEPAAAALRDALSRRGGDDGV